MFDFVQEKKRFVYVILGLIVLPFAFFGVSSYRQSGNVESPASVNGVKVSAQELDNSLRQQQEQLRQRLGPSFDAAMFDTPEMKRAVLDNLIAQHLLVERAKSAGLTVADDQIAQLIGSIAAFQADGKFDKKRYETVLANNNLSPLMYEARVRDDLLGQQLNEAYAQNGYMSTSSAEKIIRLNEQKRVVSIASVPVETLMAQIKVDDAAIKSYYEEHQREFAVPEQAKVEYVKFSAEDMMGRIEVTSDETRNYYEEHHADFSHAEQRQASHILINVAANASQAEQDAAKAKAEKLLAQIRQNPNKFGELAKQFSQDPGSAAKDGDLGLFGRGMMVKPFEEAAFSLKQGEISGLVRSDFGYHIIKVTAIKPERVLPFDEARETIVSKLSIQKATEKFAELAEKFSNTVYEQSDTLKPASELAGAKVEQSGWLVKGVPGAGIWTGKLLQAIFSDDVLKNKRNTTAVEVAPSTLVAARLLEYKPASAKPLSEVQANIRQRLAREQAVGAAVLQGKAALAELLKTGKTTLKWVDAQTVTRSQHANMDMNLVRQVFQVNAAKLPQYVGAELAQGGYAIVRVDAVKDGDKPDENKLGRYAQQLRQMSGEEMFQAYLADARAHATIRVNLSAVPTNKVE